MRILPRFPRSFLLITLVLVGAGASAGADGGALAGHRHRVIVSTDIGGTDFDDFQSMVHVLLYADVLDLEGLISSPYGPGRKEHILQVIDLYERDYPNLRTHSDRYPTSGALRAITKQGETEVAPYAGVRRATEGSDWIVQCARRDDPRPLHVLVWGGIEDLAQALHDAPDILPKLRVYFIGGPNKKWSPDACHYLATHHPGLWIIESNSSYYGWFVGGNHAGDLGAEAFAGAHAAGRGALGEFFAHGISFEGRKRSSLKMGDTPTVAWLLRGEPSIPFQPGWGGRYVRAWARPYARFDRLTTAADQIEHCGILELVLPLGGGTPAQPEARMIVENQALIGHIDGAGAIRFRFCPKEAKLYRYTIRGNVPALDGRTGEITVVSSPPSAALRPDPGLPDWWTDDPSPALAEGPHHGARTINQWRGDFLRDFAARLERCRTPAPGASAPSTLRWNSGLLHRTPEWFATAEARAAANAVLLYQSSHGAWPKNTDLLAPATPAALAEVEKGGKANTIDNGATTAPMIFLAHVANATGAEPYRAAVLRGVDYLLASQYPNGGFPQFFPLRKGYYSHITYNDGAMVNTLEVLRDIAQGRAPFGFVDADRRARANDAVARGINCILETQIKQAGTLTAWCAQHDENSLEPAWARAYEPPSLSGSESVGVVHFLMSIENPSPAVIAAVEGAVAWFRSVVMTGQRLDAKKGPDGRTERFLVPDPAAPPLWARFYEPGTNRPLYMDRDSKPLYEFAQVGYERRSGYSYHGTWPASLLAKDYPAWRARLGKKP